MEAVSSAPPLAGPFRTDAPAAPAQQEPTARPGALATGARRHALNRRLLAAADVLAVVAATLACLWVCGAPGVDPAMLLLGALVVVTAKAFGLYDRDQALMHRTTLDELPQLAHLGSVFVLAMWLTGGVFTAHELGRDAGIVLWLVFVGSCVAARALARRFGDRVLPAERCLVIGPYAAARSFAETLERDGVRAHVAATIDVAALDGLDGRTELADLAERLDVHRVILIADDHQETDLDIIRGAKAAGLPVSVMPRLMEVIGSQVEFDHVGGTVLLGVRSSRLGRTGRGLKRALDLSVSAAMLLLLAPVLALIALAVRFDSPGPALYRQTRVGRDGRLFSMLKFRTMVVGAHAQREGLAALNEADGLFKIENDPRVTRVGRVLRRASIDEIPQLVNVLLGHMSLVGPRPLVEDEDRRIIGLDRERLSLTPGMTGHWQILGSARVPMADMLKIDYLYVAGWTLWTDVKLLLRTVPYVLARRGM